MTSSPKGRSEDGPAEQERRPYNSPRRRERAAETRTRILGAGSELVHGFPSWDWRNLTFRAVAERTGVSERTVYRHFGTEQQLHRAVMHRLEEEAGVNYDGLRLEDFASVTERAFTAFSSFAVSPSQPAPPFVEEDRDRRQALLAAVSLAATDWTNMEMEMAAAILDVIGATPAYERLTTTWNLDLPSATRAASWAIDLIRAAIRDGHRPTNTQAPPAPLPQPKKTPAKNAAFGKGKTG